MVGEKANRHKSIANEETSWWVPMETGETVECGRSCCGADDCGLVECEDIARQEEARTRSSSAICARHDGTAATKGWRILEAALPDARECFADSHWAARRFE